MQELKFRGMTRKKGEKVYLNGTPVEGNWVYGGVMQGKGDFSVIYENETYDKKVVYTDTLCQYTGFKDINKKEIYKNDIIRLYDLTADDYVVAWDDKMGAFVLYDIITKENLPDLIGDCIRDVDVEVIGNIHEN